MDPIKKLCNKAETVYEFCYLEDMLHVGGSCEAAVTARAENRADEIEGM